MLLTVLLAGASQLQAAFLVDNFDSYSVGSNVNVLANGWGGADGAIVTNIDYSGGAGNSAYVPPDAVVSNTVNQLGATYPRIWTETCIQQDQRLDLTTAPLASSNSTVMVGVDTGGHLAAYDPAVTNWVSYTNDVWGTNMTLAASDWARISVMHNFSNHTAALFLDGHLMKASLAFMTNLDDYGAFQLDSGGQTNALLDNAYVSNAVPPFLTNVDLDMDLMADALEIQTYGDVTTRRWWTNTVSTAGNGTISPSGASFTVAPGSNMTYILTANEAYGVGAVTNNGMDGSASLTGVGTRMGTYVDSAISNDRVVTAWFVYTGVRFVPGDHSTITDALAAAYAGDHLVVSNGVYNESLVLSNGVILVGTNMTASANDTNLTVNGTMMVVTGTVSSVGLITVTGQVTIADGGLLTISDSAVNFGGLTVGAGGSVQVVNGSVTIAGATRTGTFTLDQNWQTTLVPVVLDYTDGFETYPVNTDLGSLGLLGWSASATGAEVQGTVGNQSVLMPAYMVVSNTVEAGHTSVWTEVYVKAAALMEPDTQPLVNSNLTVQLFVGTNGYLTLYNPTLPGWDVCSNNAQNAEVDMVSTGEWLRITVYQNFSNHTAAVFLNDQLLRAQVPFISNTVSECHGFSLEGGDGGTNYLDTVKVWRSMQGMGLEGDQDMDEMADALEIQTYGDVTTWRRLTNTVSSAGNGTISPFGAPFTVAPGSNMTYILTANEAYGVGAVTNNGMDGSASLTGVGTRMGTYVDSAISNDRVVTAWFVYTGVRFVPGDHSTITDALAAAYAGGHLGDHLVISNGVYNESLVLSSEVILVGSNMTGSANDTNLTVNGTMTVVTGTVSSVGLITVTGQVTIADGGLLTISDSDVNFGDLTIESGGSVQVVNGSVTIAGATRTGTFTLDQNWQTTLVPVVLDYTDGFETYPVNTDLGSLGLLGWSASATGAEVQGTVGNQSVLMPAYMVVSNTVEAGHTSVWTEVYVKAAALMEPDTQPLVNSNLTVQLFVGTNGYLTLYNPTLPGWDVCSNNAQNAEVDMVSTGEWLRITVYQNFSNHTAAVFLNDQLLRAQVPFISNTVSECHGFSLDGGHGGTTYLDTVKVWRSMQGMGLLGDLNQNSLPDAQEIETDGILGPYSPRGSVFKIR